MSKFIIVCGLPGSGKTTLSHELSKRLNIVCLHKDTFKERLFELSGSSTLADSKRLGIQAVEILLTTTAEQIKNGVDIMIEAPLYYTGDYGLFKTWIETYKLDAYAVVCTIDPEVRKDRFLNRPRHEAHQDYNRQVAELFDNDAKRNEAYESIPGKKINITTDRSNEILVQRVFEFIQS